MGDGDSGQISFGIYGCEHAHIGIFVEEMLQLGHTCVGIYEPSHCRVALTLAEKYGLPLLEDKGALFEPEVSAIGCAAINNEKIGVIEECEAHGKHVIVDKPAVVDLAGCDRLDAVMRRGTIQVGMLLTERFHPAIYTLKQLIDAGRLGRIVAISMRKPHRLRPEGRPTWFFSKEHSGGILIDLLVHDVDLLHWLTGEPIERIDGYMAKRILPEHPDFYDAVMLQALMGGGTTAGLYADWHTPERSWTWGDGRIFVTGTEGTAELRLNGDPFARAESGAGGESDAGNAPKLAGGAAAQEEALLLLTTHAEVAVRVPLQQPGHTITADFLRRIAGLPSCIGHGDIAAASRAVVDADASVRVVRSV
ncbi:MAG: Gfo/Idh/MocA family oxidoreductase [Paenibacillaceae bacterium]|nr:Gfo/Idh/MocA family oxidoreductase [Paenibacillaceae bacterium]